MGNRVAYEWDIEEVALHNGEQADIQDHMHMDKLSWLTECHWWDWSSIGKEHQYDRDKIKVYSNNGVPFHYFAYTYSLVLVRDEYDNWGGMVRLWAYAVRKPGEKDWQLPEFFEQVGPTGPYDTTVRVPQRFHKELARHQKNNPPEAAASTTTEK